MRFREDYARAGVPMLPVVAPPVAVVRRILGYGWATVATSLVLWPLATGWIYGLTAAGVGGAFLVEAHRLYRAVRRGERARPLRLFHLSNSYLALLFLAVAEPRAAAAGPAGHPRVSDAGAGRRVRQRVGDRAGAREAVQGPRRGVRPADHVAAYRVHGDARPGGVLPDVGQGRADHAHRPQPGRGVVRGHAHVAPATTRPVGVPHRSRRCGVGTGGRAAHRSATRLRGGAGGAPVDAVERAAPAPGPLSSTVRTLRTRTSCRRWSA